MKEGRDVRKKGRTERYHVTPSCWDSQFATEFSIHVCANCEFGCAKRTTTVYYVLACYSIVHDGHKPIHHRRALVLTFQLVQRNVDFVWHRYKHFKTSHCNIRCNQ